MTDRFSNFADLAEHYAREIATPDYAAAFMEQTELAKLSIEHEPSAAEMPDPDVAQAAIEMMLATVSGLTAGCPFFLSFGPRGQWCHARSLVLARIADCPVSRHSEQLPWGGQPQQR